MAVRVLGFIAALCFWVVPQWDTTGELQGQTVHAILAGDSSPWAHWGKYQPNIFFDVMNMHGMLQDNLPKHQVNIVEPSISIDDESDPRTLLTAIAELKPAPEDTILFYYSGHGESDDRGHYLAMAQGKLYRSQLLDALRNKGARLVVLLTDCCNLRSDGAIVMAPAFVEEYPEVPSPIARSLFLQPRGVVDINGSAPGEGAFFPPLGTEESGRGSLFTRALVEWIAANHQQPRVWDELVRGVSLQVHTKFHDYYPKGAQAAKGRTAQTQQNVYPVLYPGMPERKGPRTGILVRDLPGQGVVIASIENGSPATQAFLISNESFISLTPQQFVVSVNGQPVTNMEQLRNLLDASPQIVRMGIRDPNRGTFDVLLRLRY